MISVKVKEKETVETGIVESFKGMIMSVVLYEYFMNIWPELPPHCVYTLFSHKSV